MRKLPRAADGTMPVPIGFEGIRVEDTTRKSVAAGQQQIKSSQRPSQDLVVIGSVRRCCSFAQGQARRLRSALDQILEKALEVLVDVIYF